MVSRYYRNGSLDAGGYLVWGDIVGTDDQSDRRSDHVACLGIVQRRVAGRLFPCSQGGRKSGQGCDCQYVGEPAEHWRRNCASRIEAGADRSVGASPGVSLDALPRYLRSEAGRPFEIGRADCATLAADWIMLCHGIDPLGRLRGRYGEGNWRCRHSGRLERFAALTARRCGLNHTDAPTLGDVGLVQAGDVTAFAIRSTRYWVFRLAGGGLTFLPADRLRVLAAWKV